MPGLCKEFVQSNAHFPIFYRLHWHQAVSKTQYYNLDALILKTGLVTPQHQLPSCWFGNVPRISRQNANAPCWIETATKGHRKFKHFHLSEPSAWKNIPPSSHFNEPNSSGWKFSKYVWKFGLQLLPHVFYLRAWLISCKTTGIQAVGWEWVRKAKNSLFFLLKSLMHFAAGGKRTRPRPCKLMTISSRRCSELLSGRATGESRNRSSDSVFLKMSDACWKMVHRRWRIRGK